MRRSFTVLLFLFHLSLQGQDVNAVEALYQQGAHEELLELGQLILEGDSSNELVNHLMGRSLCDLRRFEEAKEYLTRSMTDECPEWMRAWSLGYLGHCHFATGDYEASRQNLQAAIWLNATKNATLFAEKRLQWFQMTAYFEDWMVVETQHIRFHIQPGHDISDVQIYCNLRELAYREINAFFDAKPYKKIDFYVWSKPEEGMDKLGRRIGFANSDLCIINSRIEQTRGHELSHILCDYGIQPIHKNRLINEGVAVAFDLTNRDCMALAKAANPKSLGLVELMEKGEELPESIVYPIGGALITFLRKSKGNETLKKLLKDQRFERLIELYGADVISDFESKIKGESPRE